VQYVKLRGVDMQQSSSVQHGVPPVLRSGAISALEAIFQ